MKSLSYENDFGLHELAVQEPVVETRLRMNCFAQTRFETEAKGNWEMV